MSVLPAHVAFPPAPGVRLGAQGDAQRMLETVAAWLLGVLWVLPLLYAFWTAFHPSEYSTSFTLAAPWTLANFVKAWHAAPFAGISSTRWRWSRWCSPPSWCW